MRLASERNTNAKCARNGRKMDGNMGLNHEKWRFNLINWQTSFHWPKSWKSCHCWNLWKFMGFSQLTDKIRLGSEPSKWMGQSGFYQENWWTHWEFRHEQRRKRRNIVCLNCCSRWWPSLLLTSLQPAKVNIYIYMLTPPRRTDPGNIFNDISK